MGGCGKSYLQTQWGPLPDPKDERIATLEKALRDVGELATAGWEATRVLAVVRLHAATEKAAGEKLITIHRTLAVLEDDDNG